MHRIYISPTTPDSRASVKKNIFNNLGLKTKVGAVYLTDCYTIDKRLDKKQIEKAKALLANPLVENAIVNRLPFSDVTADKSANYMIEVGYLPGVTDNVGTTCRETLEDGLRVKFKPGENVYTSQVLFITGDLSPDGAAIIADSLYNPLIQKATIKTAKQVINDGVVNSIVPKVKLTASTKVSLVDLNASDEELEAIGKLGIPDHVIARSQGSNWRRGNLSKKIASDALATTKRRGPLSLSLDYLKVIREHFNKLGRKPTDVELEMLAQTWSEHCQHTIFADPLDEIKDGIFKHYIKAATDKIRAAKGKNDFCVSVFKDNSGGIAFDDNYIITHKVETHNTPSALDPFGGAITGIVGVNRDCLGFGLGAKPVINVYGFCVGFPDDEEKLFRDGKLTQKMLPPRRILDGVVAGVNAGGNQSGIPTNLGFVSFHEGYRGKPLVFAGTVGLIPRKIGSRLGHEKQAKPNDLIVMLGGRVGADGIHGATFASETLDTHSPATAVQIGDPITQKKLSDAIVREARAQNLYNSITDCGAGGLSSSVGEMAKESGGCEVALDKIPVKYPGLQPWQIWISESQERMTLAVPPAKWKKLEQLMRSRGVEATVIGKFTRTKKCVIKFGKKTVLDLDMEFLHHGRPVRKLITKRSVPIHRPLKGQPINGHATSLNDDLLSLVRSPNLASLEFIAKQYDHEVQAGSVLKPLQGAGRIVADATVTRPLLTSEKGVVLSSALYPNYSELDPYAMAAASIDTAVRAAVCAGADPEKIALLDNFCWCSPDEPEKLWHLKEAAKACYDIAVAYGTPFISGKDSMYNDFKGYDEKGHAIKVSIPPTLLISTIGIIDDVTKSISLEAKSAGDLIYILGDTNNEMGGSEYEKTMCSAPIHGPSDEADKSARYSPNVNSTKNLALYQNLHKAIKQDLLASAASISHGGLSVCLVKTLAGGKLGGKIDLTNLPGNWQENTQAMFSESQGRIIVTINPKNAEKFEAVMFPSILARFGSVTAAKEIVVTDKNGKKTVELNSSKALEAYKSTFKNF